MSAPFFQTQNSDPFFPALMIHAWISIARMTDFLHRRFFWAHSSVFKKKNQNSDLVSSSPDDPCMAIFCVEVWNFLAKLNFDLSVGY